MKIAVRGQWYDGKHALPHAAILHVTDDGLVTLEPPLCPPQPIADLVVAARLGDTPRYLHFNNGSAFETADNAAVDRVLQQYGRHLKRDSVQALAHRLEQHWSAVVLSLCALVLLGVWFAMEGAPRLARQLAFHVSPQVMTYIGQDSLAFLERAALTASALDERRQQQLQQVFVTLLPEDDEGLQYRLLFRAGGKLGPNAFALPDATIVMTDEMVQLADDDAQLAVVLLHEIGHVKERHLLRQLLQQAGLGALLVVITGDLSGASDAVLALPGLLMQAQYSQAMEEEADSYALTHLHEHGLSPLAFAQIMRRVESWQPPKVPVGAEESDAPGGKIEQEMTRQDMTQKQGNDENGDEQESAWRYLSTHPATSERIRRFEQAAGAP